MLTVARDKSAATVRKAIALAEAGKFGPAAELIRKALPETSAKHARRYRKFARRCERKARDVAPKSAKRSVHAKASKPAATKSAKPAKLAALSGVAAGVLVAAVKPAICATWQCIGADMPDPCKNIEAVEACIDADRLATATHDKAAGEAANAKLREAIDAHGYDAVLRALAKAIRLA